MSKHDLLLYKNQIAEWHKKYGIPPSPPSRVVDLTQVSLKLCVCGQPATTRHHKGSQLFLARVWPDIFAPRYIQFHPDDVVWMCERCHKKVERAYIPLKEQRRAAVRDFISNLNLLPPQDLSKVKDIQRFIAENTHKQVVNFGKEWIEKFEKRFESWLHNQIRLRNAKNSAREGSNNSNRRPPENRSSLRSRASKRKNRSRRRRTYRQGRTRRNPNR